MSLEEKAIYKQMYNDISPASETYILFTQV